jgi:hypothetical protein
MCRELAEIVSQLLKSENKYIKKQATLAATRIIRKSPENINLFIDKIENLLKIKQHGNLLCCVQLMITMLRNDKKVKE